MAADWELSGALFNVLLLPKRAVPVEDSLALSCVLLARKLKGGLGLGPVPARSALPGAVEVLVLVPVALLGAADEGILKGAVGAATPEAVPGCCASLAPLPTVTEPLLVPAANQFPAPELPAGGVAEGCGGCRAAAAAALVPGAAAEPAAPKLDNGRSWPAAGAELMKPAPISKRGTLEEAVAAGAGGASARAPKPKPPGKPVPGVDDATPEAVFCAVACCCRDPLAGFRKEKLCGVCAAWPKVPGNGAAAAPFDSVPAPKPNFAPRGWELVPEPDPNETEAPEPAVDNAPRAFADIKPPSGFAAPKENAGKGFLSPGSPPEPPEPAWLGKEDMAP